MHVMSLLIGVMKTCLVHISFMYGETQIIRFLKFLQEVHLRDRDVVF